MKGAPLTAVAALILIGLKDAFAYCDRAYDGVRAPEHP